MSHPLLGARGVEGGLEAWLGSIGRVFRAFRAQDSGCVSFGVEVRGRRWFVKHASEPEAIAGLRRALAVNSAVRHPALPRLHHAFGAGAGLALVYDFVEGEVLYDYTRGRGARARRDPASPAARFRALPPAEILAALDVIYDAHLAIARAGFVAVDFYDGSVIYDFERRRVHLCDLDSYRPGPFVVEAERLPGSSRFMAPEEWRQGARIDEVTNVFTLGRTALELLGSGEGSDSWRGRSTQLEVAARATAPSRGARYGSVAEFVSAWRSAAGERGAG